MRENDEGTGWPQDKPAAGKDTGTRPDARPESPEQAEIRELKSELSKTKNELYTAHFELARTSKELGKARTELREAGDERRKLIDTVSRQERQLERKDAEIEQLRAASPVLDGKVKGDAVQDNRIARKPSRRNWFPSEKVSAAASAGIGTLGAAGVALHQISGNTESLILAGAGFGFAALAVAKDRYEKRKERKNADRPENQ